SLVPAFGQRGMRLLDPDGTVVASGNTVHLQHPISLETLGKSRDADGNPRLWSLEVLPSSQIFGGGQSIVSATVIGTTRINTGVLQDRIDFLLGEHGSKISIFGEMDEINLRARLQILDIFSA